MELTRKDSLKVRKKERKAIRERKSMGKGLCVFYAEGSE